jgi:iron complex transport system substrate-binding protein
VPVILKRVRRTKKIFAALVILALLSAPRAAAAAPERILSLSPAATEIIFCLGFGDKVIGVTEYCTWPPEALAKPNVGDMMFLNMETLISMAPDLVLLSNMNEHLRAQVESLGFRTVVVYQDDFDQICDSMLEVGAACGVEELARQKIAELRDSVREISERAKLARAGKKTRVLLVVGRDMDDESFKRVHAAGRKSFYQNLLEEAGAENAMGQEVPYVILSKEGLVRVNPEMIIELVGEHGMANVTTPKIFAQWEKITEMKAVREGRVGIIRGDFTLRPGPRYPMILDALARIINGETTEITE